MTDYKKSFSHDPLNLKIFLGLNFVPLWGVWKDIDLGEDSERSILLSVSSTLRKPRSLAETRAFSVIVVLGCLEIHSPGHFALIP